MAFENKIYRLVSLVDVKMLYREFYFTEKHKI